MHLWVFFFLSFPFLLLVSFFTISFFNPRLFSLLNVWIPLAIP